MAHKRILKEDDKKIWEQIDALLEQHCDGTEIAAVIGVHPETLYDAVKTRYNTDFSSYRREKRAAGAAKVRGIMYNAVCNPKNVSERIFWAKNFLGMSDQPAPDNREAEVIADEIEKLKEEEDK